MEGLVTIHMFNMKVLSLLVRKLWPRLKFLKVGQTSRSRSRGKKKYGTMWKVLSQGKHMCNMKVLSLLERKLWQRLKFFKSRSNFKVKVKRSKIMVPCERSCHKEYTCNMKALSLLVRKLWPRLKFLKVGQTSMSRSLGQKILVWCERSCNKECTCAIWKPYRFW